MADDFQLGSGNWWDSTRNRVNNTTGVTTPVPISTTLNAIASYEWPPEMKSRSDSGTVSGGSMVVQGGNVLPNPNLQMMMGLGLSSQGMEWNQPLFRGEKDESNYRSMLQEDLSANTSNFQCESDGVSSSQEQWRHNLKQINREFSLDSNSDSGTITSHNLTPTFPVDPAAAYRLLLSENPPENNPNYENQTMNYNFGYGTNEPHQMMPTWKNYPPEKQAVPPPHAGGSSSHLHFTNNTPYWNASASAPAGMSDARSNFNFRANLQQTSHVPFDENFSGKKNTHEVRDLGVASKKNISETSNKRTRINDHVAASPLPASKVRKEKMGDRITALQQLVAPFGKTDTASVLSEAIDYIKFLHEQVSVLSTPYMKNGPPIQHQQNSNKSKDPEGPRQDLRSRGLCLVPVSSTFPVTHESTVDFWTPTYGGTFR